MDEISTLQLVMDDDCDWNDSEDEDVTWISQLAMRVQALEILRFSEPVGPAEPNLPSDATPLDFFMLMVGEDFFKYLATETNRYAAQKPPLPSHKLDDTNADEMMLFIGMIFAMGMNVQPKLEDYWKNDSILGTHGIVRGIPIL